VTVLPSLARARQIARRLGAAETHPTCDERTLRGAECVAGAGWWHRAARDSRADGGAVGLRHGIHSPVCESRHSLMALRANGCVDLRDEIIRERRAGHGAGALTCRSSARRGRATGSRTAPSTGAACCGTTASLSDAAVRRRFTSDAAAFLRVNLTRRVSGTAREKDRQYQRDRKCIHVVESSDGRRGPRI